MGRSAEAIVSLQRALEIEPRYAEAHNNLGAVFLKQGKLEEATASFQQENGDIQGSSQTNAVDAPFPLVGYSRPL